MELSSARGPRGAAPWETPPEGAALWTPGQGAALTTREGPSALSTPMRVGWNLGFPLAGVTARNRRAATRSLRLAAAAAERVSRLRARLKGFAVIVAPPTADSPLARRRPLETFASCRMEGKVSASSKLCNMHPSVTSGRGVRRSAEGECKALCPRPQTRNPLRRRSGKPQAARRGAPVARRDPCKGTALCRTTRMGVERAEGPSRVVRAAP